jgi:hypothetical protein
LGVVAALSDKDANWRTRIPIPIHFHTGNGTISFIITMIIVCLYFFFSYQLLMGAQSVSKKINFALISIYSNFYS